LKEILILTQTLFENRKGRNIFPLALLSWYYYDSKTNNNKNVQQILLGNIGRKKSLLYVRTQPNSKLGLIGWV
jgi:hypothetical protein